MTPPSVPGRPKTFTTCTIATSLGDGERPPRDPTIGRNAGAARTIDAMVDDACPTCGKPLDVVDVEGRHIHAEPIDRPTRPGGSRATLVVGIVCLILLVGVVALSGGGDDDTSPVASTRERSGGADLATEPTQLQRDLLTATESFASIVGNRLIAYRTDGAVALVGVTGPGVASVTQPVPEILGSGQVFFELDEYEILNQGDLTYAIDADNDEVFLLYNRGPLVLTPESFTIGRGSREEPRVLVATTGGFILTPVDIPVGAATLAVPGLGVLVMPPTGGSFLATSGGLESFSEHRILGASVSHHVEVRCGAELICNAVLVDRAASGESPVPDEFADGDGTISISPDGRWVALLRDGDDLVLNAETGVVASVDLGDATPAWAPDSSYLAWLAGARGQPLLWVFRPESLERDQLDLSVLGAPDRIADELLIFD